MLLLDIAHGSIDIVVIIGIFLGYLIAWMSKEEMEVGREYIRAIKRILFVGLLLFFNNSIIYYLCLAFILYFISKVDIPEWVFYVIIGLIYFRNLMFSSLVFIYGLFSGSYMYPKKRDMIICATILLFLFLGKTLYGLL